MKRSDIVNLANSPSLHPGRYPDLFERPTAKKKGLPKTKPRKKKK